MNPLRPSFPVSLIAALPVGRRLALRVYNRLCMTLFPKRRARTSFGAEMDCDVRDMIQATIIHLGCWEPRLTAVLPGLVERGDTVADIGANIGYFSLLLSKAVGTNGQVVAVEALPRLATVIASHRDLNHATNLDIHQLALSDHIGTVTLYEAGHTNVGMTTIMADRGFQPSGEVPCAPLLDVLSTPQRESLTLIKIDIEGAEPPVIRDLTENLDQYPRQPAIAVEISPSEEWSALFGQLLAAGYRAFDLHNDYDWLTLIDRPTVPPTEIDTLPDQQADILFARAPRQVDAMLARAEQ